MKRLIMCTAGHVDHGKTALVRALTGIDCDTHPEEQKRGITINPGFAYLDLEPAVPGETKEETIRLGIVDVPGHHRFIRNMLAGACGVDFALMVIAVDDAVMPQTREHLAILELLGVRDGLVALTKSDLATDDLLALACEDIRAALEGSFLAQAEIVPVSAVRQTGLSELRAALRRVVSRTVERSCGGVFRMYIDRLFSVAGFGTVVTGSVMQGQVSTGDTLSVLPGGLEVKVRRIERHGVEVPQAVAGDRASLNLLGLSRTEFVRGMLLADRSLRATESIDAELMVIGKQTVLGLHSGALFYVGTHETPCRIHLLDAKEVREGKKALVQIELQRPAVMLSGDRFIVRSASADRTLGGGRCIDAFPLRHKRRSEGLVDQIRKRASGELKDLILAEIGKSPSFVSEAELGEALGCDLGAVRQAASKLPGSEALSLEAGGTRYFLASAAKERMGQSVRKIVEEYHREFPLNAKGIDALQIGGKLGLSSAAQRSILSGFLETLVKSAILEKSERGGYVLPRSQRTGAQALAEVAEYVRERLTGSGMNTVPVADLEREIAGRYKASAKELKAVLKHLVEEGAVVAVDDLYLPKAVVEKCRQQLVQALLRRSEGLSVAEYRDLVQGNRKICLALLTLFDREGITRREGDLRRLTDKGRQQS